jgi:hypothetical protein
MVAPVLPDAALAPLRAMDEAGLTATVILESETTVRQPDATYVTSWVAEPEQPGRINPLGLDSPLRGDQPSSARRWELSLRSGSPIYEGQRALVKGQTNGVKWQRLLFVNEVLFPRSHELRRRALCLDVDTNP